MHTPHCRNPVCEARARARASAVSEPSPVAAMRPSGPGAYIAARTSSRSACARLHWRVGRPRWCAAIPCLAAGLHCKPAAVQTRRGWAARAAALCSHPAVCQAAKRLVLAHKLHISVAASSDQVIG
jgi:hypothetical protein